MLQRIIGDKVNVKNHESINSALIDVLYGKIHKQYYEELMMKEANGQLANCWVDNTNAVNMNKFDSKSKSLLLNKNTFNNTFTNY